MRNRDKYSVSAMCDVLQISRSTYYYEAKERHHEDDMTKPIVEIFEKNRKAYGTRKIKAKLHERGLTVSRRRIGRIMKEQGLVSTLRWLNTNLTKRHETSRSSQMN